MLPTRRVLPGPAFVGRIVPEDLAVRAEGTTGIASFNVRNAARGTVDRRTFVFRRSDGRWKIIHFHASTVEQR